MPEKHRDSKLRMSQPEKQPDTKLRMSQPDLRLNQTEVQPDTNLRMSQPDLRMNQPEKQKQKGPKIRQILQESPRDSKLPTIKPEKVDRRAFAWSNELKARNLALLNNNRTVITDISCTHQIVMMDRPMVTGEHFWKIKIDAGNGSGFVDFIGVCEKHNKFNAYSIHPGYKHYSYEYCSGRCFSERGRRRYSNGCNIGDVITVKLKFEQGSGTLRFSINDKDQGVAFKNLKGPLYPMAHLYTPNAKLTIVD